MDFILDEKTQKKMDYQVKKLEAYQAEFYQAEMKMNKYSGFEIKRKSPEMDELQRLTHEFHRLLAKVQFHQEKIKKLNEAAFGPLLRAKKRADDEAARKLFLETAPKKKFKMVGVKTVYVDYEVDAVDREDAQDQVKKMDGVEHALERFDDGTIG